jgi:MerR family transcriptional regulator, thiopeptide resistance regulator
MNTGAGRRWSVGELARASGVTVRTLHYYEEIGLVAASERTPAGHRRYTGTDISRLYRVRALHRLGLSLAEIGTALNAADDPAALRQILVAQLADLDVQAAAITEQRSRIRGLLDQVDGSGMPGSEQFLAALDMTAPVVNPQRYLTPSQREELAERGRIVGHDAVEELKARWLGLVRELRRLRNDGVPPGDPRAQAMARRWQEIGVTLRGATGDDQRLNAALAAVWRENRTAIDQGVADRVAGLAAGELVDVVEYVQQARRLTDEPGRRAGHGRGWRGRGHG